jgi:hypothetical protein
LGVAFGATKGGESGVGDRISQRPVRVWRSDPVLLA